jgi:hypothetical protein
VLPAREANNLAAIFEAIAYKMWDSRRLTILQASTAGYRDSFTFFVDTFWLTVFQTACSAGHEENKRREQDMGWGPQFDSSCPKA